MKSIYLMAVAMSTVVLMACGGTTENRSKEKAGAGKTGVAGGVDSELPLPVIPAEITEPVDRADYMMAHFWDAMDFADHRLCLDTAFMEQNYVNFVQLQDFGTEDGARRAVGGMLADAAKDEAAFAMVQYVSERYLNDPESPMRNEDRWIMFLEELLRMPDLPDDDRLRPAALLATARKNRPGAVAADFTYVTRDGRQQKLHETRAQRTLLLFYDPACEHCEAVLNGLRDDGRLRRLISRGRLRLLAVCAEEDRALWNRTKGEMPREWIVGYDLSGILKNGLYSLPAMPTIYVLDADKTVILKDPRMDVLDRWIGNEAAGS